MKCKVCGKEYKKVNSNHLKLHKLTPKEYYDKFFKQDGEEICPVCGKENAFLGITAGYRNHCSCRCSSLDKQVQCKVKNTRQERYGDENYSLIGSNSWNENIKNKYGKEDYMRFGTPEQVEALSQKYPEAEIALQDDSNQAMLKVTNMIRKKHGYGSVLELEFANKLEKLGIQFIPQYKSPDYPFYCDFFLPSYKIYIELHIGPMHGGHWFNKNSSEDRKKLKELKNSQSEFKKVWAKTWSEIDLEKKQVAIDNKLNYVVLFSKDEINDFLTKVQFKTEKSEVVE